MKLLVLKPNTTRKVTDRVAQAARHQADYSTVSMSGKIAQCTLDKARKLVELIEATLESTGGKRCIWRYLPVHTDRTLDSIPPRPVGGRTVS